MAATKTELAEVAQDLGVTLPVGVSEANTLIPILEAIVAALTALDLRVTELEP